MILQELTTVLYFLPATGFAIASAIFFEQMRDCVNEKLPEAERCTFWKIFLKQISYARVIALYRRNYPNGNLATLYWVCYGFSLLSFAGGLFCISIAAKS